MRVIWQHNSMKQCATTPAKLHAQFHFGSFFFLHSLQEAGQHHWGTMWGAMESGQGGKAEEAGREGGCEFGVLPSWGTVGLGLASYRLVSLPSLEMAC